ncbi:MAG: monofunctional biosynthetic peptidoglycan transglycosylase [Vicinamibacterales bacterium]
MARPRVLTRLLQGVLALAATAFAVVAYAYLTLPDVRTLATDNPETTAFMDLRTREAAAEGRSLRHERRWLPYGRISSRLKRAVLIAEDDAFYQHDGVDLVQLREAVRESLEEGGPVRGASTITQQLAKNLYLSPSRDPLRKVKELLIARRLERALTKDRIFELYLNVIEWGDGIWGADAAARAYFGVSASSLSDEQAALLAGAIINPRVLDPARPNGRLRARQRLLLGRMRARGAPALPSASVGVEPAATLTEDSASGDGSSLDAAASASDLQQDGAETSASGGPALDEAAGPGLDDAGGDPAVEGAVTGEAEPSSSRLPVEP